MQDYGAIIDALEKLVNERATGTLFVTTSDKHSVRFGIDNGKIVSVVYRATHGAAALPLVQAIKEGTPTFQLNFILPVSAADTLPSTRDLIEIFRRPR